MRRVTANSGARREWMEKKGVWSVGAWVAKRAWRAESRFV